MKKELLNLLQEISYAFDEYAENIEDDSSFWKAWSKMHKYISNMKDKEGK